MDFLDSLGTAKTDTEININSTGFARFHIYLRGKIRHPSHHGITFRDMIDDAILSRHNVTAHLRATKESP